MSIKDLYAEQLYDNYKYPKNKGKIETPDFESRQHNPSCGDTVIIYGLLDRLMITDLKFDGEGCVISQATASILTEYCKSKTIEEVIKMDSEFIMNLIGTKLGPSRLKCAVLSLRAIQEGLQSARDKDA